MSWARFLLLLLIQLIAVYVIVSRVFFFLLLLLLAFLDILSTLSARLCAVRVLTRAMIVYALRDRRPFFVL
jgi:uncharacterized membrane protein